MIVVIASGNIDMEKYSCDLTIGDMKFLIDLFCDFFISFYFDLFWNLLMVLYKYFIYA